MGRASINNRPFDLSQFLHARDRALVEADSWDFVAVGFKDYEFAGIITANDITSLIDALSPQKSILYYVFDSDMSFVGLYKSGHALHVVIRDMNEEER